MCKMIALVDSLSKLIVDDNGEVTCLRKFITGINEPKNGRPYITSVCPIPTPGNAASVYTLFTTYQSGVRAKTLDIAKAAKKFVHKELAAMVWKAFLKDQAQSVLAPTICQRLELMHTFTAMDTSTLSPIFNFEIPENNNENDEDDATILSAYQNSVTSVQTSNTNKTTQSTKERMYETIKENERLAVENENMKEKHDELGRK